MEKEKKKWIMDFGLRLSSFGLTNLARFSSCLSVLSFLFGSVKFLFYFSTRSPFIDPESNYLLRLFFLDQYQAG